MIFTNAITLVLALAPATLFAAPTPTVNSVAELLVRRKLPAEVVKAIENGVCDLSKASMPVAPTPLSPPAEGLRLAHIAIGRGTQNYTCASSSPTETPTAVGAFAKLYNATCNAVRSPAVFSDITKLALNHPIPDNDIAEHLLSGHHEFTEKGIPLFNMNTERNKYGYVQVKKNGSSNAPDNASKGLNNLGSVPWLKLINVEGDYQEVYRVRTAGGVAPKTCEDIQGSFQVEYAAEYWLWK